MATSRRASASTPTGSGFLGAGEMEKYRLVSNIGKGSFGVISKVQRIEDGKVSVTLMDHRICVTARLHFRSSLSRSSTMAR